ncbi:MAG: hypothetical protein V4667_07065 [Bacteroidota bacterium]
MLRLIFKLIFLSFIVNSCIVKNQTRGIKHPKYCDKNHLLTGKKAIVKTVYGKLKNQSDADFPYARKRHAMGCLRPIWPVYRLAKIYTCDSCTVKFKSIASKKVD